MNAALSSAWINRYKTGPFHRIPVSNFAALHRPAATLFQGLIAGKAIDLYVYNADTSDLIFGRASLANRYPRELAHHVGLVEKYLGLTSGSARERFSRGSMDIAVGHAKKVVYFKHLTLGLEDRLFPNEIEWLTHIGSLQDMAMKALASIGMPATYSKQVVKATEWARVRTGLMRGKYIPYEQWKKSLRGTA